jgi:hypothetical protein
LTLDSSEFLLCLRKSIWALISHMFRFIDARVGDGEDGYPRADLLLPFVGEGLLASVFFVYLSIGFISRFRGLGDDP